MAKNIIETFDLTKIYKLKSAKKEIKALDNVNISIKEGEIFGLLGPNGAGKTTMIQILTTLRRPTSGYATINGYNILKNPVKMKDNIALMLGSKMIYYRITAYDNLKFFCRIYEVPNYKKKIKILVEEFGLQDWLNEYVENFSSGMKMKLALCRTLLLNRDILFLDEPTLGLDVKTIDFIVGKIRNLNKTIFLTSHDMNVVEKLCNRIAFINKGKIIKIGSKEELKKLGQSSINIEVEIIKNKIELEKELKETEYVIDYEKSNNGFRIELKNRNNYKYFLSLLGKYDIQKINEREISLEKLFLQINK